MKKWYLTFFVATMGVVLFAKEPPVAGEFTASAAIATHQAPSSLVYSPNGDGWSDVFALDDLEPISGQGYVFEVVDLRSQTTVYRNSNYENNNWDFVDRQGGLLPSDISRSYGFSIRSANDGTVVMRGSFVLSY